MSGVLGCLPLFVWPPSSLAYYSIPPHLAAFCVPYTQGMRAVKSVLTAAAALKRAHPDAPEASLALRALRAAGAPKLLARDEAPFAGVLADLFPRAAPLAAGDGARRAALRAAAAAQGLQPAPALLAKALQLHETMLMRHGVMLVGPAMAGKTAAWRALAAASGALAAAGEPGFERVTVHAINPKAMSLGQLYGRFDDATREWADGALARCVREAAAATSGRQWVLLDGPVDALWVENLNTGARGRSCANSDLLPAVPTSSQLPDPNRKAFGLVLSVRYTLPHTRSCSARRQQEALPRERRDDRADGRDDRRL